MIRMPPEASDHRRPVPTDLVSAREGTDTQVDPEHENPSCPALKSLVSS
jgi:hypothetical protein